MAHGFGLPVMSLRSSRSQIRLLGSRSPDPLGEDSPPRTPRRSLRPAESAGRRLAGGLADGASTRASEGLDSDSIDAGPRCEGLDSTRRSSEPTQSGSAVSETG